VSWPPKIGETLPRATEATGVRDRLADYSLNPENERGAAKARGFALILGITLEHVEHLEAAIRAGIATAPVTSTRENAAQRINCVVEVPVHGVGEKRERVINVRTVWELAHKDSAPRLVTAYPRP
jgi:hypothetical protein